VPGLCLAKQVHGRRLRRAPDLDVGSEGDALYTTVAGTAVGVVTADCVPLLLADAGRRCVAAVHAGWRGAALAIAEHVVVELTSALSLAPSELVAVVGPHIGPCCYEVDDPVRAQIPEDVFAPAGRAGHYMLDLFELNRRQLERAGVTQVERVGGCTCCDPRRFASYRRDGGAARMVHWARMPSLETPGGLS
jgi:YfiH family protein